MCSVDFMIRVSPKGIVMKKKHPKQYFFKHEQMDFEVQIMLGSCSFGSVEIGEVLATIERIPNGDFEAWYTEWYALAERIHGVAERCMEGGHAVSAREAYLRAANYYAAANLMIDGSHDISRREPTWMKQLECWELFCSLQQPAAERIEIPYENTPMPGYFFKPDRPGPHPVVIFANGSDGSLCGMWAEGVASALKRGYAALVFDGPGQNSMLWQHNVPFRHDWEHVITPVVDALLLRKDVDATRLALSGISQGGYWILRALAFEHRIAVGIADPGVMNVFTAMSEHLPKRMLKLLDEENEKQFNKDMEFGMHFAGKAQRQMLAWRMKPYGTDNAYTMFKCAQQYNLRDVIKQITCPVFISDPEHEQFWPGQAQEVYDALECPKTLVHFAAEDGVDWHCEPKGRAVYDQRMFDWLHTVMPA